MTDVPVVFATRIRQRGPCRPGMAICKGTSQASFPLPRYDRCIFLIGVLTAMEFEFMLHRNMIFGAMMAQAWNPADLSSFRCPDSAGAGPR